MAGANFDRIKNWQEEVLTHDDLNREIDNILEHFNTDGMASYSETVEQMQTQTDPGTVGDENLATSLAGEIERLRFVIRRLLGDSAEFWYEAPARSISELADIVDILSQAAASHRIVSGLTTGNSSQLNALEPAGASPAIELQADVVPFSYYIKNVLYSLTENVSVSGLLTAPEANNTATINDILATDNQNSEFYGQFGSDISIDNAGSEITSRIGQMAAFKNGDEVFIARISSATKLTEAFRGCFFDPSLERILPEHFADDDTITLLRLTWVFINADGEFVLTYNTPRTGPVQPAGAAVGDYWFDTVNDSWKSFNSVSWVTLDVTLIGMCAQDGTGTIAARTFDQALPISGLNQVKLKTLSAATVGTANAGALISVAGKLIDLGYATTLWDITEHLDTGFTEAANTWYYFYLTEIGGQVISPIAPMYRGNLQGFYHPHELWRCVGYVRNDGSSDFETVRQLEDFSDVPYPPHIGKHMHTVGPTDPITANAAYGLVEGTEIVVKPNGKRLKFMIDPLPAIGPAQLGAWRTASDVETSGNTPVGVDTRMTASLTLVRTNIATDADTLIASAQVTIGNRNTMAITQGINVTLKIGGSATGHTDLSGLVFHDTPPANEGPVRYELHLSFFYPPPGGGVAEITLSRLYFSVVEDN